MDVTKVGPKSGGIQATELDLVKLISHFAYCNKAEGKTSKTVAWYSEMLFDFVKFLRSAGRRAILAELDAAAVREFIITEQARQLSPYTVQGKVRALKAFSSWLRAEGYVMESPLANVKLPRVPQKIVEILTAEEIDRLLSAQNPLTAIGARNIALLIALLDAGPRVSEVCNVRLEDAHIDEGYLKVIGKGNRERIVPIGASAQKVLWRYIFHFRPESVGEENDCLFLTLEGRRLTANAVKLILERWGKRAGVPRLHAHLCRHTFATNYLLHECGDVFRLKQILGHKTLEMVNRYVHYASAVALIQTRVSSPVDQLGIKKLTGYGIDRALRNARGKSDSIHSRKGKANG